MAYNDRIDNTSNDIYHGQQAPAQAARIQFTPGKAYSRAGDENWPKDFRVPQSTPAFGGEAVGPVEMGRQRVVKLGRGIVCDQVIAAPVEGTPIITAIAESGINGTSVLIPTNTQQANGVQEKTSGQDRIVGA